MNTRDNLFLSTLKIVGIHILIYFSLFLVLSFFEFIKIYPTNSTLQHFDAGWYRGIIDQGYSFKSDAQSNVAFFPLFPLIWKITGLSALGISLLNFVFFITGLHILRISLNFSEKDLLLLLSIPSVLFCYIPYSEAIFFLAGSLLLYGLDRNHKIALLGIFISSTIRSASMVFLPVILFSKLYYYKPGESNKKLFLETGGLILSSFIGTILAQYYVYLQSGKFFGIFEAQKHWGRVLSLPKFFLSSWGDAYRIWLDGLAFLVGLISAGLALFYLWRRFSKSPETKPSFLFSVGYLATVTLVTLLYSGDGQTYTSVSSLNRFIFAVPFFSVLLVWWMKQNQLKNSSWLFFIGLSIITWISFAPPNHYYFLDNFDLFFDKGVAYILITLAYSIAFFLLGKQKIKTEIWSGLYILNILVQVYLFSQFLNNGWVG